ncbi:MAG: PAS domain-containing protein [Nitrosomonas sp.]|uniref:PAS domain-containing protein n=1 Tax=Nitrosomonas sp. TaxID=42353 RepID=UPI0025D6D1A6|nr:PAS domain-containing protein [Nitrosomonas sp.]UJP02448.1 MAG: PAS domain-containing protein [Nitrosomonas sp.]
MNTEPYTSNPFIGLRPFSREFAHLFFGRDGHAADMIRKLCRKRFLAVVGTSGSGKSSLVGAGLIPTLLENGAGETGSPWRVAWMRPGAEPVSNLAHALAQALPCAQQEDLYRMVLAGTLRRSSLGLVQVVEQARIKERLVLCVDQFEEVFRYVPSQDRSEQSSFVNLMLEATKQSRVPIFICITMRSEFFGECARFYGLPETINEGQYLVPRMTRSERKAAIVGPMEVAGLNISNRLLQKLLNDLGEVAADYLPTLQHVLMRTFAYWRIHCQQDPTMDLPHYEAVGTIENALDKHAESIFQSLNEAEQVLTESVFKRLTLRVDNGDIRHPASCAVLADVASVGLNDLISVIERFRQIDTAFLMPVPPVALESATTVDVSHESLMRIWRRLRRWVEEEAQSAFIYRRLRENAELHAQYKSELLTGRDLEITAAWYESNRPNLAWADRYGGGFETAKKFLLDSQKKEQETKALEKLIAERDAEVQAMREQSSVLRNVLSSIPHRVFWKNWDSVYQGANEKFARSAGLSSSEEIIGKTDYDLVWTHEEADYYRQCDREVMELGQPLTGIEESQLTSNGETATVLTDKVPLRNSLGEINGILGISLDITERKHSEEILQQALNEALRQEQCRLDLESMITQKLQILVQTVEAVRSDNADSYDSGFCRIQTQILALLDLISSKSH